MNDFCDTSFFLSVYLTRSNTEQAKRSLLELREAIPVSGLLLFELENALRLGAFRFSNGEIDGISGQVAESALAQVDVDFEAGRITLVHPDYGLIIERARSISNARTWSSGFRSMDILHVARELAEAEGLDVAN